MGIPRVTGKTVPCGFCEAKGRVNSGYGGYAKTTCPVCLGRGKITVALEAQKCKGCGGTGRRLSGYYTTFYEKHAECHGTGWITRPTLNVPTLH
jgi:hypothetical protein